MHRQVLTHPFKKENLLRALIKACVYVNDSENIFDLIQELKWVGYLTTPNQNRVWMKVYLHINESSMLFIKYGRFVILGILACLNMPGRSRLKMWYQFWTEVYLLWCLCMLKSYKNLNSLSWDIADLSFWLLWVWLVSPDYTQLNQEYYMKLWMSIYIYSLRYCKRAWSNSLKIRAHLVDLHTKNQENSSYVQS